MLGSRKGDVIMTVTRSSFFFYFFLFFYFCIFLDTRHFFSIALLYSQVGLVLRLSGFRWAVGFEIDLGFLVFNSRFWNRVLDLLADV